jgi:uncharacterized protein YndB with AHSA1/START domain
MTPTPTGRVISTTATGRDLVLERTLPGSIDDAWASITESDRLARWFCTWTGEPRVGGTVELTLVAEEGDATSHAEILACEPPTHLTVSTHDPGGAWLLEVTLPRSILSTPGCALCTTSTKRPTPRRSAPDGSTTLTRLPRR